MAVKKRQKAAPRFRLIGFSHLYLYLDDPSHDEEAVQVARGIYAESFVSFALHTPELREEWKSLRTCRKLSEMAWRCFPRGFSWDSRLKLSR